MDLFESFPEIWKALDEAARRRAATVFLEQHEPDSRIIQDANAELARALKFRPESVANLSIPKKAGHLAIRLGSRKLHRFLEPVLVDYLVTEKLVLLSAFLDHLGMEHESGFIQGDPEPPDREQLAEAIGAVLEQFPEEDVELYLSVLHLHDGSQLWGSLSDALEQAPLEATGRRASPGPAESDSVEVEREDQPESSEDFTTLDNLLIHTAVASATGEIGAMEEDQLFDLVEEVTALNADRRRSYFHKGFLDALFDREYRFSFRGENAERRAWYFRGVMLGLLRADRKGECLKIIEKESALAREVAESRATRCGAELLPHLYPILMEGEKFSLCCAWLQRQMGQLEAPRLIGLLLALFEDAADLVRQGKPAEAILLLEILVPTLQQDDRLPQDFVAAYLPRALRKFAQAHQGQGNFAVAEKEFARLAENPDTHLEGAVFADLGLIRAGLRSLADVAPRGEPDRNTALREALERGEEHFREAVEQYGEKATNAHFILGILGTLRGHDHAEETVTHLQQARTGMLANQEAYENGDLLAWAAGCLALALLESAEASQFQRAADLTRQALESPVSFPLELWERFLRASTLFDDDDLAVEIAERLLAQRGDAASVPIRDSGVLGSGASLRQRFMELRESMGVPADEWWADWRAILQGAMEGRSWDQAEAALDRLEETAQDHSFLRDRFVELLTEVDTWTPVWDEEDVEDALARIHEQEGRHAEACDLLQRRFHLRKASGNPWELEQAARLLERIRTLDPDHLDTEDLARQLEAARGDDEEGETTAADRLAQGANVSLIYIGGNETQAQYEQVITERLTGDWPGVTVEFHFPGWSSKWGALLETLKPRIREADAVVLSHLVRTNFGRHVRKTCDSEHPWFPCNGRGKQSIEESLRQAARWVARRR